MENNELQKIWKSADSDILYQSKKELNLLLTSKAKQVLSGFLLGNIISAAVSIGVTVWLIISASNRINDKLYVANNVLLGIIIIIAMIAGFRYAYQFRVSKMNQPVKEWLDERIHLLSVWLTGSFRNIEFYLFPVLFILTFLSIHVYYAELSFIEVFQSDKFLNEDMWGMIIFIPLLLAGGFYSLKKIRKYHTEKLQFLKDLRNRFNQAN
jgi:cytochrome bd-type quinol oxidase subunit 2